MTPLDSVRRAAASGSACNARTEVLTGEAAAEHYALGELETRRKEAMQLAAVRAVKAAGRRGGATTRHQQQGMS